MQTNEIETVFQMLMHCLKTYEFVDWLATKVVKRSSDFWHARENTIIGSELANLVLQYGTHAIWIARLPHKKPCSVPRYLFYFHKTTK